tara:strand:+ start:43 stop:321 length:279 start_codon:yes stop_codon:yes gene_type:complete
MSEKFFKTPKNRALGASKESNFALGDIVSWKTWEISLENEIFETKEGLLVEIIEETRLENVVLIAKIMPFGASEYEFVPLFSIRKSNKQDYL